MDMRESMRTANEQTLEWVRSVHQGIVEATKSYVASLPNAEAPEPPAWSMPQVAEVPNLRDLIEDTFAFQAEMLEQNKKFSLALAEVWTAVAPNTSGDAGPETTK